MYNIKILQECTEEEYVAIVAVINKLLDEDVASNLIVKRFRRIKENTPEWALVGKQERLRNKF